MNYASTLDSAYSVDIGIEGTTEAGRATIFGAGANWAEARPDASSTLLGYEGDPEVNNAHI